MCDNIEKPSENSDALKKSIRVDLQYLSEAAIYIDYCASTDLKKFVHRVNILAEKAKKFQEIKEKELRFKELAPIEEEDKISEVLDI